MVTFLFAVLLWTEQAVSASNVYCLGLLRHWFVVFWENWLNILWRKQTNKQIMVSLFQCVKNAHRKCPLTPLVLEDFSCWLHYLNFHTCWLAYNNFLTYWLVCHNFLTYWLVCHNFHTSWQAYHHLQAKDQPASIPMPAHKPACWLAPYHFHA